MNIEELIKKLSEYNKDKHVYVMDEEGELVPLDIVCVIKDGSIRYKPHSLDGDILVLSTKYE